MVVRGALLLLTVLLLSSIPVVDKPLLNEEEVAVEWIRFDLPKDSMKGLVGMLDEAMSLEDRPVLAHSRLGIHDSKGVLFEQEIPEELLIPRTDLNLVLISSDVRLAAVRAELDLIPGLAVREFISPSGLMIQGTQMALSLANSVEGVASSQPIPLAMLVDFSVFDKGIDSPVRIESWRGDFLLPGVDLTDSGGNSIHQEIDIVAQRYLDETIFAETGRYDGYSAAEIATIASEPSVAWIGLQPSLTIWNDQARNHMNINTMSSYYTTDLDGAGQIVAVADSGLDEDHGDFGSRVIGNVDVIGDGSTADAHSGHGTHVSCTILGDGSRGTYAGVAPEAELYFQAMENDNSGNFQWASINNMLNTAYNQGARTHSNSWGSKDSSEWGVYTSSSEDVDDRARYYDQYYSGKEGLTILFAAGNDGPQSDTIGAPATAKNTITVGNSQNRYSGAPSTIMDGSSRGPVDDGRIKPDVIAPGGFVRSCRAQEATDTSSSTWSNNWYLEYTGTSMATPNAAGTAALIRQYITEIAQRPEPQGALVKALMILGANDVGSRDIPNNDEGWGRIDLKNTLAPNNGRGIWVDDRSVLSSTGNTKTYSFNITTANQPFKVVLAWSDERGSRFSSKQLVNNLDLLVTDPIGTEYRGNVFSQGRSIQGGDYDTLNNVEVVLVDNADMGLWSVRVKDSGHSGSKTQPFAIAVSGVGVNDLRPDPSPIASTFGLNIAIPQVGDDVLVEMEVANLGNVEAENVEIIFQEEGVLLDSSTFDLGPGGSKKIFWNWQPQTSGSRTLSFIVDDDDTIDEINEDNNRFDVIVNVTTPGVKIESDAERTILTDISATTSSWQVTLTNTALVSTNASISPTGVTSPIGDSLTWYVGLDQTNFIFSGQEGAQINVTLVHPAGPSPGIYLVGLLGQDNDNNVTYPFTLELEVPILADTRLEYDYQVIPVHPYLPTLIDVRLLNLGNADVGYDLFLNSPPGWHSGFNDLSAQGGANSGSTGLMLKDGQRSVGLTFTPPQVMTLAGAELIVELLVVPQTENPVSQSYNLALVVMEVKEVEISLETSISSVMPGTSFSLQYSIENRGNVDVNLTPRLQLPVGWEQNTIVEGFSLSWTGSRNLLISVSAGDGARSGNIRFILDGPSESWDEIIAVEVIQLAEPSLTFVTLEIAGETWTHPFGPGEHPAGVPLNYTWLVTNNANTNWNPSVVLSLENVLLGECSQLETVTKETVQPLTCTIIISAIADPGDEPEFTVILDGDMVRYEEKITMLVAPKKEITWKIDGPKVIDVGELTVIQITITNVGNTMISNRIEAIPPSGWVISFDGLDTVTIEAGQAEKLRLEITAKSSGEGTLSLSLVEGEDVTGYTIEIEMIAEGEIIVEETSNLPTTILSIVGIILLLGIVIIAIQIGRKKWENKEILPTAVPLEAYFEPEDEKVPCWSCRQPILSSMLGCPECGARYHSVCKVETCLSCGSDPEIFVKVEE